MSEIQKCQLIRRNPCYFVERPRYEYYSSQIQYGGGYGGYATPVGNSNWDAYNLTDIANQANYNESEANITSSTASGTIGGNNKPYNLTKIAQRATYNKSTAHITSTTGH